MLFDQITMINYARPLAERLKYRRSVGPYSWKPTEPGKGRGFYSGKYATSMDAHGSTFRLRIRLANGTLEDHGYGSLARIDGYFTDEHQDEAMQPIIALLPHSRGWLAGWTLGAGMAACVGSTIYETPEAAARAAHRMAERDAEEERDYQARELERIEAEEEAEETAAWVASHNDATAARYL